MTLLLAVLVSLAGAAGAVARYLVDTAVRHRWAPTLPWATLLVNVSGSLVLGILAGVALDGGHDTALAVLGTGFCGGYTTFSTTSLESVLLLQQQRYRAAAANAAGTLVLTVLAAAVGFWLGAR